MPTFSTADKVSVESALLLSAVTPRPVGRLAVKVTCAGYDNVMMMPIPFAARLCAYQRGENRARTVRPLPCPPFGRAGRPPATITKRYTLSCKRVFRHQADACTHDTTVAAAAQCASCMSSGPRTLVSRPPDGAKSADVRIYTAPTTKMAPGASAECGDCATMRAMWA